MRLAIRHTTRYSFQGRIVHGLQRLRLMPKETQGQKILDWSMEYEGAREELSYDDQNHNHVTLVSAIEGAEQVVVTCRGTVDPLLARALPGSGPREVRATDRARAAD